jgi:Cu(I)/Ag(I) efflux system periplasmic protein CusF
MQTLKSFALAATFAMASTSAFAETMKEDGAHRGMSGGMSGEMHKGMKGDMQKNMDGMHENMGNMKGKQQEGGPLTQGVVRKIDAEARTLTIKHGPIKNLGMPPMTMVFQTDASVEIDQLKTGESIRFRVVDRDGKMTVTEVKPAS